MKMPAAMPLLLIFLLTLLIAPAAPGDTAPGQGAGKAAPPPPAPPGNYLPPTAPGAESSGQPEPEVTITTKETEIHEEYRLNGRLYMIKVIPKHGKPYYLVDPDGNGQFRRYDFQPRIAIPQWVIKRW
jgi:hypothetical protein